MKAFILFFIGVLISTQSFALKINFDDQKPGQGLSGWDEGFYGSKGKPSWKVETDATAPSKPNVLKQTGNAIYNWKVLNTPVFADGIVEADLKVISGKEDPEVGLVWRHKDGENYYYVRINAIEDNVIFYRMNQGKKEVIKEIESKVGFDKWHHLKIQFNAEQVDVFFDQKNVISIKDKSFKNSGKAGFFTTADTVGAFDNFNTEQLK